MKSLAFVGSVLAFLVIAAAPAWADESSPAPAASDDDGFVSLFDGKSLDGWHGDSKGHVVKDGKLICQKVGKSLYSDKEYADFRFKFEFKLTPGANNGLCIRAPKASEGNPAFVGMEIQILDDSAEKWKGLKPYQYHGSVYGVVPAKRGHLKPVGEWNAEEIICRGSHVIVKLNGTTIVDADVKEAGTPKTLDGAEHSGIHRAKGHLVLFGHGDAVEFRNLRIKELDAK